MRQDSCKFKAGLWSELKVSLGSLVRPYLNIKSKGEMKTENTAQKQSASLACTGPRLNPHRQAQTLAKSQVWWLRQKEHLHLRSA